MGTTEIKKKPGKVRQLICSFFNDRQASIYLVGSWARGEEKRTSDIDVAILSKEPLPVGFLADIAEELEQSDIPYRVELVDLAGMDANKRKAFLEGAIQWKG